ncbi:MAG: hypothetical protein E7619_02075 [Ruminococcaceae bacterium]|nr:hypothetical protein [Oscillospiraceae bacterium]
MKKILFVFVLCIVMLLPLFVMGASAADDVVFIGGEGDTYATIAEAAAALPATGGTVVVRGPVDHPTGSAVDLPAKPLVITSVYGGVDYAKTNGAYFGVGRTLNLYSTLTIENITMKHTATGIYGNIYARGNSLTLGEGITTVASSESKYTNVFGGFSGANNGTGHKPVITVKSGTWQNVYGGSYTGTFNGDPTVIMTGGKVVNVISGGGRFGNFTGNAKVDISGGETYLVVGGIYGVSGSSCTFTGDVDLDIHGNAKVAYNVYGASYYGGITFKGNIAIDIYGSAQLSRHVFGGCYGVAGKTNVTAGDKGIVITVAENASFIRPTDASNIISAGSSAGSVKGNVKVIIKDNVYYPGNVYAAGYSGSVDGDSTAIIYGGEVKVNFTAAARSGNVTGKATTEAYGGKIGYYTSSEYYGIVGTNTGTVGSASVLVDGADVAGAVKMNGATGTLTVKSGKIGSVTDKCVVDLTGAKELQVGGNLTVSTLTGGGTVIIPASASITADSFSGNLKLIISGSPVANQTYLTVADAASSGVLEYTPVDDETMEKQVGANITYSVKYSDRYDTTKVRIYYYNPDKNGTQPLIVLRSGVYTGGTKLTDYTSGTEDGKAYIEADLAPGLYSCKVYYGSGADDYRIKYFYVNGKAATASYDLPLAPYVENSWSENISSNLTDEVMALFGTEGLIGYNGFDTPTFDLENSVRTFMNNEALCAYVDKLGESCDHLYVYYPFKESAMGNRTPVLIFTNDAISGMSFDDAAAYIRSKGEREIVMITGGKHGNEPAGPEGTLVFSKDLCGDYGKEVLEKIGAIVIMPSVEVDNFQRFKRLTESGVNPNRDLLALFIESSANQVYVFKSFMPTVTIDCHEDSGNSEIDPTDLSVENLDDICIRYSSNFNSPLYYGGVLKEGSFDANEILGNKIMMDVIERTKEVGLRGSIYYSGSTVPNTSSTYPSVRGAYGFLVETMRIWTGTGRYERAVFGIEQALKGLIAEVIEYDGALAENVYAARRRIAAITDYDPDHVMAITHSSSGISKAIGDRPTIYASGEWKDKNGTKAFNLIDTLSNMIVLPTAYVFSPDIENIDNILAVLDMQGIPYVKLAPGSTLNLRKYSGGYANTAIGAAENVTFENGAYAVTMNNCDAYLIAYLFEPNSNRFSTAEDHSISFAHMGYISDGDGLYRSEENGVYLKIADMAEKGSITHASITVGVDLKVNAFAELKDGVENATVKFTLAGEEYVANGTYDETAGLYRFVMPNMPPHGMTVKIKMELVVDGNVVDTVSDWTVRGYCDYLLNSSDTELGVSAATKSTLDRLVADILEYGAAAQNYKDYVSEDVPLANEGITTASSFSVLDSSVNAASITKYSDNGVEFVSVGVRFDSVVKVFFRFKADDLSDLMVSVDGIQYDSDDFEAVGDGEYIVYSDAISPLHFVSGVYANVYRGSEMCQQVIYSVDSFVYEMQNDMDGEELSEIALLARRLYRYSVSARTYFKTIG